MAAIERDNPSLKSVLPKDYARPGLDKQRLGQLINLVSDIGLGSPADRARDILGRVYEYFLSQFASAEGKKGGQFYTPTHVVRVLVEMLAPYKGRVYDPCCGSGGMFVQSEKFIEAHRGRIGDISIYGQESNYTTWRLAEMNLAIRGIDAQIVHGDSFHNDQHPDLKADYVLANPHFNDSDWRRELLRNDKRWAFGAPPAGNANFAWVQHFIHHLAPNGTAGFVLANGSMSSNQSGEGGIRKAIVEADLVDCMVTLPGQLFYSTPIPACLWFLARDKRNGRFRDRRGETLFIDARKLGTMVDRVHRELTDADIAKIAATYHAWRGDKERRRVRGRAGFLQIGVARRNPQAQPCAHTGPLCRRRRDRGRRRAVRRKMRRLVATFRQQQAEAAKLDATISANLRELGYAG
jgi:type I restriction enzyme M protein